MLDLNLNNWNPRQLLQMNYRSEISTHLWTSTQALNYMHKPYFPRYGIDTGLLLESGRMYTDR